MGYDDRVLPRVGRHGELDLRVAFHEGGERGLDEGVHAAAAAPPVAVVEFEAFALQDEGADAVLWGGVLDRGDGDGWRVGSGWDSFVPEALRPS